MDAFIHLFPLWKSPNCQPPQPNLDVLVAPDIARGVSLLVEPVEVVGATTVVANS